MVGLLNIATFFYFYMVYTSYLYLFFLFIYLCSTSKFFDNNSNLLINTFLSISLLVAKNPTELKNCSDNKSIEK